MEKNTEQNNTGTGSSQGEGTGYVQELNRTLSTKDLIIFGLIVMLPIAPTQVYPLVAGASFGMPALIFMVGMVTMFFTAYSYARMSREFPIAGSSYSFVQRGMNPHVGFVVGWIITSLYIIAPAMLVSMAASWLSGGMFKGTPVWMWVILIVAFNSVVNILGIELAAKANMIMLALELLAVILFLFFAVRYVVVNDLGFTLTPVYQAGKVDFKFIEMAAAIAVLGFIGFDSIANLSEEVKNPRKSVPRAVMLALFLIGTCFIVQSYMAALVHPNYTDLDPAMGFFDIAKECGGQFMYMFFLIIAILAVGIANALAVQTGGSRLLYSMGRDKVLPFSSFMAKIHPKYKTPVNTILFEAVIVVILSFVPVEVLIALVNFSALTTYAFMNITSLYYFFFKKKQRGIGGFIKNIIIPAMGFIILGYVWFGLGKTTLLIGFGWMILGIIIGFVKSKGYKEVPPVLKEI